MHPPYLPLPVWWILSAAATVLFLAFFNPLLSSRRHKIRMCYGPAGMVVLCAAVAVIFHAGVEQLHIMYCSVLLALVLSFAGRRGQVRRAILDQNARGISEEVKPTTDMWVQLALSLTVIPALGIWLLTR
ncbi:hypothetical protein [Streptomyces luteireticuli]|uniref:DUF5134 domain-containing protein n=1 Tax=Streptomyces luteireticuli TaxID=173858 RepID=A0ABN0Z183_9ACTN